MALLSTSVSILQATSPLAPSSFEWAIIILGALHLILSMALIVWLSGQKKVEPILRLAGVIVAVVIPVIGSAVIWLAVRRSGNPSRG